MQESFIRTIDFVYCLDILGTFVFALSGVLTAVDRKFDVVGAIVIGSATAIGGGTIRDLLIGKTPVGWMMDTNYIYSILLALVVCYLFYDQLKKLRKSMFIFDTIGIGLFTIIGVQVTLALNLPTIIAVMMGITSAVMGGVVRDTLTNEVPLIFRKEIYASACLAGALVFITGEYFFNSTNLSMVISISTVITVRTCAVVYKWELPFKPKGQ